MNLHHVWIPCGHGNQFGGNNGQLQIAVDTNMVVLQPTHPMVRFGQHLVLTNVVASFIQIAFGFLFCPPLIGGFCM
jgi:hypothetical protein